MQFFKLFVLVALFAAALVSAAPVIEKRQATPTTSSTSTPTSGAPQVAAQNTPPCNSAQVLSDDKPATSVDGQVCDYGTAPTNKVGTKV
ncbi:hypothetical protein F8M41_026180 [Gigaspora margarita]|uniref:Uncharacterized protein n=1 Tax=Gigaspora margarita TaxID=4874 RepID=A0A8H4A9K6_GIGMA|nr:hypothetical protein F8M41_026180 [Gigaspora margarita]